MHVLKATAEAGAIERVAAITLSQLGAASPVVDSANLNPDFTRHPNRRSQLP
jgi:hypothetical protein